MDPANLDGQESAKRDLDYSQCYLSDGCADDREIDILEGDPIASGLALANQPWISKLTK